MLDQKILRARSPILEGQHDFNPWNRVTSNIRTFSPKKYNVVPMVLTSLYLIHYIFLIRCLQTLLSNLPHKEIFQEGPEQEINIEERNFTLSLPGVLKNTEMKREWKILQKKKALINRIVVILSY